MYDTHVKSHDLIKLLKAHGWQVRRIRGSHHQMVKDGRTVTVPHPKKDLGMGLVRAIMRSAGIDE
ncbi:MAG: type II toxin-antitoxin system HicA family toxin [Burkholderiaceae bacterium]